MFLTFSFYNGRFATRPDLWRSKQASKLTAYEDFSATFGSSESKSSKNGSFLSDTYKKTSQPEEGIKKLKKEIGDRLASPTPFLSMTGFKRKPKKAEGQGKKYAKISVDDDVSKGKNNKSRTKND